MYRDLFTKAIQILQRWPYITESPSIVDAVNFLVRVCTGQPMSVSEIVGTLYYKAVTF